MGNPVPGAIVGQIYNPSYNLSVPDSSLDTTTSVPPVGPLSYTSDTPTVVSVDSVGIATMVGAGTATVTVVDPGNNLTDTVVFTVAEAPPKPTKLIVEYTLAP